MNDRSQGTADMSPLRMWADLMSGLMATGNAFTPEAAPPDAFRQMRSHWLSAWSSFWENYSRSPQFLDLMQQTFSSSLGVRKQFNDYLAEMHHQFQGVSRQDVDSLMQVIQHLEQRLVDESERITHRLNDLSYRLEQLHNSVLAIQRRVPVQQEQSPSRSGSESGGGMGPINF